VFQQPVRPANVPGQRDRDGTLRRRS
jgi:hypothetical protein